MLIVFMLIADCFLAFPVLVFLWHVFRFFAWFMIEIARGTYWHIKTGQPRPGKAGYHGKFVS
jgi:hypothetical protein